ncbi:MAG: DNA alkylation repair protein [Lentisphaerae bacterium]|nr:DNA alkylation repair protein [Lentisphaerota bacterium]
MAVQGGEPPPASPVRALVNDLARRRNPSQAEVLRRFFKTGPGEYGEGDRFWGLKVPEVRAVLARHPAISLPAAGELLDSPYHEARLLAVLALVRAYDRGAAAERRRIFDFYLAHAGRVNNWDLVDLSAPGIAGRHLPPGGGRRVLARLAKSPVLWERRIAMVATLAHIRQGDLSNTFWLAERLLEDREDLMHKAAGWMLREAGKRDEAALEAFLARHAGRMPRTLLRYAIERLPPARRRDWLQVPKVSRKEVEKNRKESGRRLRRTGESGRIPQ